VYNRGSYKKFQDGAFLMWRKSIHDHVGYFDEYLESAGDQDFWYRVINQSRVRKCDTVLGIYTDIRTEGISKISKKGSTERALIARRYGFWSPINFFIYLKLRKSNYQYAWWENKQHFISNGDKPINFYIIANILKSLLYTMLFYMLGNSFYRLRPYL